MSKLTLEQQEVVEHYGNAVVTAVAGAGKSHVCFNYCKMRPDDRILYLAYNSSVKKEAMRKFASLPNVSVETGHSLAFHAMEVGRKYQLREMNSVRVSEVVEMLKLPPDERNNHLILARHIINHFNKFLNSCHNQPEELRYLREISDLEARAFVGRHRDRIIDGSTFLFEQMRAGKIPLTHDCYLKLYQLSQPVLPYSAILVDEGQDTNPPVMDIFLKQRGYRVIVGDSYQSIYSWRGAEDTLSKVDFAKFYLTGSFRFDQHIADLGMRALKLREWIGYEAPQFQIRGLGGTDRTDTTAYIARSNLGLLEMAINHAESYPTEKFCFEGGFTNYSFNSHGASLFDIVNVSLNKRDKLQKGCFAEQFNSLEDIKLYAKQTDDAELRLACRLVDRYKGALIPLIYNVKNLQVPRNKTNICFSSGHRCKGAEYHCVTLADDFTNGKKLNKAIKKSNKNGDTPDYKNMAEGVNLLYVAITRAMNSIEIPFDIERGKLEKPKEGEFR